MTYTLLTTYGDDDLARFLATDSKVVVAKPAAEGTGPNVAWIAYNPLTSSKITWEEEYGIYASSTDLVHGATLHQVSQTSIPAAEGALYTLNPDGSFGGPGTPTAEGSFTAQNLWAKSLKGYMTMGLYQNATVDQCEQLGSAVSAAPVMTNYTAVMTPYTTVYLWVQSQVESNTVVTTVTSPMTKVTFGGDITTVSLSYQSSSGTFIAD